jgi:hypothetical protein
MPERLRHSMEIQTRFQQISTSPCSHQNYVPFLAKANRFLLDKQLQASPPIGTPSPTQGPTTCPPASNARSPTSRNEPATTCSRPRGRRSRCPSSSPLSTGLTEPSETSQALPPTSSSVSTQSLQEGRRRPRRVLLQGHPQIEKDSRFDQNLPLNPSQTKPLRLCHQQRTDQEH